MNLFGFKMLDDCFWKPANTDMLLADKNRSSRRELEQKAGNQPVRTTACSHFKQTCQPKLQLSRQRGSTQRRIATCALPLLHNIWVIRSDFQVKSRRMCSDSPTRLTTRLL